LTEDSPSEAIQVYASGNKTTFRYGYT